MFLNDGKLVFSLFIILLTFSRFIFRSCDSVSLGLLGYVLFGSVAFSFSEVGSSFLFGCFCLTTLDVSGIVLFSCLFVFWCISSISGSENQPFIIVLTWLASLWFVVWKLAHSCQISIILFLISSLWRVAPKIAV